MAAKLLGLGLFLAAPGFAAAQSDSTGATTTLHFRKPAGQTWVPVDGPTVAPGMALPTPPPAASKGIQQVGYKQPIASAPAPVPTPVSPPLRPVAAPMPAPTNTTVYSNTPVLQSKPQLPMLQPTTSAPVAAKPTPAPVAKPMSDQGSVPFLVPEITRTAMQQPQGEGIAAQQDQLDYSIFVSLVPPGPQKLFKLESEAQFKERLRQEARERPIPEQVEFPPETQLTTQKSYAGRNWPRMREPTEPNYVCHGRLLFEEMNTERFAWDLGIAQPLVSSVYFGWDVVTVPYHLGTAVCRRYECSAGKCLPGSPVPYILYPPEISVTGSIAEAAVIIGLAAVFP